MAQTQFLAEFQIVPLDRPAQLGQIDQPINGGIAGYRGEPEACWSSLVNRPFGK
jgi:hypothetical protein